MFYYSDANSDHYRGRAFSVSTQNRGNMSANYDVEPGRYFIKLINYTDFGGDYELTITQN